MPPPQLRPALPSSLRGRSGQQANLNHPPLPDHWEEVQRINGTPFYHCLAGTTSVYSPDNPHRWEDPARLQDTIDHILARLTSPQVLNVSIVIALPTHGSYVKYYLVDEDAHEVFWFHDPAAVVLTFTHTDYCCDIFLKAEYWHHIENFPPNANFTRAENDLIWRLWASKIPGNELLNPWTREQCQQHIETIESNRDDEGVSARVQAETLGNLLAAIYTDQHDACHGLQMGRRDGRRNEGPVVAVARTARPQYSWSDTILILMDLDRPLAPTALYYVLVAVANKAIKTGDDPLSEIILCISAAISTVILLIAIFSLPLYIWMVACFFDVRNYGPYRNWVCNGLLVFKGFVYGCLLSTFGGYLSVDPPENQLSFAGLVMLTFVLALPPAFHILRRSM